MHFERLKRIDIRPQSYCACCGSCNVHVPTRNEANQCHCHCNLFAPHLTLVVVERTPLAEIGMSACNAWIRCALLSGLPSTKSRILRFRHRIAELSVLGRCIPAAAVTRPPYFRARSDPMQLIQRYVNYFLVFLLPWRTHTMHPGAGPAPSRYLLITATSLPTCCAAGGLNSCGARTSDACSISFPKYELPEAPVAFWNNPTLHRLPSARYAAQHSGLCPDEMFVCLTTAP